MKRNILIFLSVLQILSSGLQACDANCVACHPKLIQSGDYDNNHKILKQCTKCHTEDKDEEAHGACGSDCWQCHSIKKVSAVDIPEHKALAVCIKCHMSIDKDFFNLKNKKDGFSDKLLIDSIDGVL